MPAFFDSVHMQGILSFPPDGEAIPLRSLNLLIGPNGSGKSNLLEVISLLRAVPVDLAGAIREGGGIREWRWKGKEQMQPGVACVMPLGIGNEIVQRIRYRLEPGPIVRESIGVIGENTDLFSSFDGIPFIFKNENGELEGERITLSKFDDRLPVLAQIRDPEQYRVVTWLGSRLRDIAVYQDSSFGRFAAFRQPQPADLPNDDLLPDGRNLGLVLMRLSIVVIGGGCSRLLSGFCRDLSDYP